jgi:large subunit ribosomal protein L24
MRIKKNDTVLVTTGQYKGKTGRVVWVDTKKNRVLVEGVNKKQKHQRPTQKSPKGGIVQIEAPIHISNVSLFVKGEDGKPKATRISRKIVLDGGKKTSVRVSRLTGEEL